MRPMRALRTLASRRSALVGGPLVLASLSAGVLLPASAAQAQQSCVSPCLPTSVDRLSSDPLRQLTSYLSLTPAALLSPSSDDDVDDVAEQAARDARLAARRAAAERAAAQRAAAERAAAAAAVAERAAAERAAATAAAAERAAAAAAVAERAAAERAAAAAAQRAAAERAAVAAAERTAAERAAVAVAERTAAEQAAVERAAAEQAAVERAAAERAAVERTQTGVPMPSPLWSPRTGRSPAQEGRTRANPGLALPAPAATNGPATGPLAPAPSDGQPETAKQAGNNEEPLAGYSGGAASRDDAAGAQTDGGASSGGAGSSTTAGSTAAGSTTAPRATTGPSAATQPPSGQAASASTDTTPSRSVPLVTTLIGGVLALLVLIVREIVR